MWILVVLVGVCSLLFVLYNNLIIDKDFEKIPGPKGLPIFGNSFDILKESVELFKYFRYLTSKYPGIFKLTISGAKYVLIYNPEDVEIILTSTKHIKKGFLYFFLRPWLNDGLLLSSGTKWYERRKFLTPAFHFNILRNFSNILVENTDKFVESLRPEAEKQKTDIYPLISNMTLNSICETAMGTQLDKESSGIGQRYKDAIHTLGTYLLYRSQRFWMHPSFLFNLSSVGQKQQNLLNLIGELRDRVIKQRRDNSNYKKLLSQVINDNQSSFDNQKIRLAMLDLLLNVEEQGKIDAKGINEEVDTFMFEGHDTTATALLFTFMLLANHIEEQNKIYEECLQIFGSTNRTATMNDLSEMKYLECCIKESLRLYPPVYFMSRSCEEQLILKDYKCAPGTDCTILVFDLHRSPNQFIEPLRFRPERFMEKPTWHQFAYVPFSAGSRNCIGQKFAMMEMKFMICAVLRRYRLMPVTKPEDINFIVDIILRPKDPIYVKFEKR